ncbi:bifunctional phosphoribosylaminoimidazolecarboxamide formyltransferase/IMP cyclohydrolase [Sphingobacterium alkalisoli]|uniref:Bifunctional purine biosynthesis protein PurH n=1 Tax=Sphingobacterium alkalisoli TaxID=1874115 RepID=A0A4U0H2W7_9SPHI|nr:bifunctional phosphoribosylaminoimidazolecarboxamide formyltransferase/IMP cyclohydrolase [Sphingobacterium alkalisoli]TJY65960.1 bifunctional phosphoribosylaminoimidazolecarboxamide formyltransferase/IMP cyclohydrolase [Sphingobacterium alkalisoli]GGH17195.1 bifunctional purine biosynthesis protein PurH [Sphingobacterium alkalisoli]
MNHPVKIKNALVSVYYKDNLAPLIQLLNKYGVTLYSTGGTEAFIRDLDIDVVRVEDLTSYPSILGGRVKTLHPKVFGGILSRRPLESDQQQLARYEIPEIDLVIVDLYPFEETLASGASEQDIIEKIDIGGISLIRAAAKNFNDVVIISSKTDYTELEQILASQNGVTTLDQRKSFAKRAFNTSSHYDTAIFNYFNQEEPLTVFKQSQQKAQTLRYGENPHQKGIFFGDLDAMFDKLNGKELSYNNLVDVDAAVAIIDEFEDPTFAILKHTNACGVASRSTVKQAWIDALACDPISAFGGVLITNREVDAETAEEINKLFFEVLIAPSYSEQAKSILTAKKNRIILIRKEVNLPTHQFKTLLNGVILQDKDHTIEGPELMTAVTIAKPSPEQLEDLYFANKIVKHTKSNTIVFAKNGTLLTSGVGQTSRVDALKQAIEKAHAFGFDLKGSAMASDAFFPFPDCVEIAGEAGIAAVLQPGGSIKDQLSIDMANEKGLAMVVTGVRHFKH